MGGVLCVAIRRSNGDESIMERWTNDMPGYLIDPLFRSEDDATIKQMEETSTKLKVIEGIDYGIIAIDFVTKEVLSRQGYFNPFHWNTLWRRGESYSSHPEEEIQIIKRLLDEEPAPQVLDFRLALFDIPHMSAGYIAQLKIAVNEATSYTLPPFVESMTFVQYHPFIAHQAEFYRDNFDWKTEVYDWLRERGWKSKIAKEFKDID